MTLILVLTCLLAVLLIGECWLMFQILSQQGRLLLRLEAVESRAGEPGLMRQVGEAARAGLEVDSAAPAFRMPAPGQQNGNTVQEIPRSPAPEVGQPAPDFSLPDLSGNLVKLSDFRGSATLVLFWRPSCGFCQRMLPALKAWEERPPDGAPRLLVVSSESVADNRVLGLHSPIVLDHTPMSVGSQFGVTGTPMAVLVDEEGKVASALTAGAPAVLALVWDAQEMPTPVGA